MKISFKWISEIIGENLDFEECVELLTDIGLEVEKSYDFSNINKVFQSYIENGIKPIVEYDYLPELLINNVVESSRGNDEGMTIINTGPNDWKKWSDFMKAITQNFIDEFGIEEVRSWFFEVWNEPDGWPNDQLDIFYKMYDVFVDAVKSVDSELRVGGPACYHEYFLKSFLNHVTNGINYVTGKKGTQIEREKFATSIFKINCYYYFCKFTFFKSGWS